MSALLPFLGIRRPSVTRPIPLAACPLCGAWMARALDPDDSRCRLGACRADPPEGSAERSVVDANRAILREEMVEVEFSIAALNAAIALARSRGTPCGGYLERTFPLAMRRRILAGYLR